jgi:hypothetical protein
MLLSNWEEVAGFAGFCEALFYFRSAGMTKAKPKPKGSKEPAEVTPAAPKPKKKAAKSCQRCSRWKEVKRQMGIAGILEKAVKKFETKLEDDKFQPTVAEYLKLVQIEQEYEKELNPPEEIQVTWVEPTTESESSK